MLESQSQMSVHEGDKSTDVVDKVWLLT
jgi:hypothetical protein